MQRRLYLALVLALPVCADVVDSAAQGFTVKNQAFIKVAPDKVYRVAISQVDHWWDSAHTFSGSVSNLTIEDRANGCFREKLPNDGGVRHMTVIFADPGKILRMSGGLGPLQSLAVAATITWTFSKTDSKTNDGSRVEWVYTVGGYVPGGLQSLAEPVDNMLKQPMARLKAFLEK